MPFFKTVGCDCDCGPDPCTSGCPCTFDETQTIPAFFTGTKTDNYPAGSNFDTDRTVSIIISNPGMHIDVSVLADGASIYDSGLITGSTTTTASVPAGTSVITIETEVILTIDGSGTVEVAC